MDLSIIKNKISEKNIFLYLYIFLSGIVFFEPALAEYLFLISIPFFIRYIKIDKKNIIVFLLGLSILISGIYGIIKYGKIDYKFIIIDFYLLAFYYFYNLYFEKISIDTKKYDNVYIFWFYSIILNLLIGLITLVLSKESVFGISIWHYGERLEAFFKDPNVLSSFCLPPFLYFTYKIFQTDNIKSSLIYYLYLILIGLTLLFTMSRASILALVIGIIVISIISLLRYNKDDLNIKNIIIFVSLVLIIVIILLVFIFVFGDKIDINGKTLQYYTIDRFQIYQYDKGRFNAQSLAFEMIKESPFFGVGPGNYKMFSRRSSHNLFARVLGEKGLFGFIIFFVFFVNIIVNIFKSKNKLKFLNLTILIMLLINSLFIDSLHWRHLWFFLIILNINIKE